MANKLITAMIILTVAALCAACAFQYLEMESFGLPVTLKERFFPAPAAAAATENSEAPAAESAPAENADGNGGENQANP